MKQLVVPIERVFSKIVVRNISIPLHNEQVQNPRDESVG